MALVVPMTCKDLCCLYDVNSPYGLFSLYVLSNLYDLHILFYLVQPFCLVWPLWPYSYVHSFYDLNILQDLNIYDILTLCTLSSFYEHGSLHDLCNFYYLPICNDFIAIIACITIITCTESMNFIAFMI